MSSKTNKLMLGLLCLVFLSGNSALADSLYGGSLSARETALGGAVVASPNQPLEIMADNPAGLARVNSRDLSAGFATMFTQGQFSNAVNSKAPSDAFGGATPYGAFVTPIASSRFKLGFSATPVSAMGATWHFVDAPGGLGGTSYGLQRNQSSILAFRFAGGIGFAVNSKLSIGFTLGAVYNSNTLVTPYVFQSQPVLQGFKTLIDLHTSGVAPDGSVGLLFTPTSTFKIGLSYKTRTVIHSRGDLSGNANAQLATLGVPFTPTFHYNAQVDNVLPNMIKGGFSWQVRPRLRLALQGDWINWNKAFVTLPITLTNGDNAQINGFVGSSTLRDGVPLNWHNQGIFRVGVEKSLTERTTLQAGYSFGNNPVPSATVLPLTAAIMNNTLGTGIGYRRNHYGLDVAYQYQLPNTAHVGQSAILAGEYNNSQDRIATQSLAVTSSFHF